MDGWTCIWDRCVQKYLEYSEYSFLSCPGIEGQVTLTEAQGHLESFVLLLQVLYTAGLFRKLSRYRPPQEMVRAAVRLGKVRPGKVGTPEPEHLQDKDMDKQLQFIV